MPSYEVDVNFNTDTGSLEEASEDQRNDDRREHASGQQDGDR